MSKIWLSPEVLEWTPSVQGWKQQSESDWKRAHILWNHADRTIRHAIGELHLVDGITALKRALNQRIQHLVSSYDLHTVQLTKKTKGNLELLESLGVIKPILFRKLLTIRNALEHTDSSPPPLEQCVELQSSLGISCVPQTQVRE